jgi:multidrug resistance protein MdtO
MTTVTATTVPGAPSSLASQSWEFLRRELAPTPGRWQATVRLTLACIACTVPIMVFHLQEALVVMVGMFMIAKEDTTTTLLGTVLALLGVTVGCGLLLLFYVCALDLVWLRVLAVPAFVAFGLFLNRTVTLGPMGITICVPLALGMVLPDANPDLEFLARLPFYFWWGISLGLLINLVVQYLLNRETSLSVLVRAMVARLDAVERMLGRLAAGEKTDPAHSTLAPLALAGVVEQLHLLKLASVVEHRLKKYQAELRAQFILLDRLVTAAAVLEMQGIASPNEAVQRRLHGVAEACARWRTAVKDKHHVPPEIPPAPANGEVMVTGQDAIPSLSEMERAVKLMPFTFPGRELPAELRPAPGKDKGGVLVPDAFTNPEYIRYAIKGALAAFICYLIFTLADYPGIYTSVITCIVCAVSTVGASVQKGVLRFAGAAVGGALGVICFIWIFPNLDSLGGFWFPFGAVTALAAYVTFGSLRISYCGYQIAVAFYKISLEDYGPSTELVVVRDRLMGIALGLVVFGVINSRLWPVTALETTRVKLVSVFRSLVKLAGLPDENKDPAPQLAEAYVVRQQVQQDLGTIRQLFESSRFESGAARRDRLEAVSNTAQMLFLHLLAIIQHRPDLWRLGVPEPLRAASARFRATLAEVLLCLSDRVRGKPERPLPDLSAALPELDQALAREIKTISDPHLLAQIRGRLALYQETLPIVVKLAHLPVD